MLKLEVYNMVILDRTHGHGIWTFSLLLGLLIHLNNDIEHILRMKKICQF